MTNLKAYVKTKLGTLHHGDCVSWLKSLPSGEVELIFADPPYNIKKAEWDSFESQQKYVDWCMEWIQEARRILSKTGTLYIMGFSEILAHVKVAASPLFAGCKWLVWYYRNKANLGKDWGRSHESILHFRKSKTFTLNMDAIRVPYNNHTLKYPEHPQAVTSQYGNGKKYTWKPHPLGAKPRDVIEMPTLCNTTKEKTLHPTQKPEELVRKFVLASSNEGELVLDPFGGSGTTYIVCERYNRRWLGCEISEENCQIIKERLENPDNFSSERINGSEKTIINRRQKLRFGKSPTEPDATQMEMFGESDS